MYAIGAFTYRLIIQNQLHASRLVENSAVQHADKYNTAMAECDFYMRGSTETHQRVTDD
jgi:hypothetical protein